MTVTVTVSLSQEDSSDRLGSDIAHMLPRLDITCFSLSDFFFMVSPVILQFFSRALDYGK